jgi:hypothetical protein
LRAARWSYVGVVGRTSSLGSVFFLCAAAATAASACGDDEKSSSGAKGGASGTAGSAGRPSGGNAGSGGRDGSATGGKSGATGTGGESGSAAGAGQAGASDEGGTGGAGGADAGMGGAAMGGDGGLGGGGEDGVPTFGPVQTLARSGVGTVAVGMGTFGTVLVVWAPQSNVVWARLATNQVFAAPVRLNSANAHLTADAVAVSAIGEDAFVAVWTEFNNGFGVYARKYTGSWEAVQTIQEEASRFPNTRVAMNAAGDGVLGLEIENFIMANDESASVHRVTAGVVGSSESLALQQTAIALETAVADNGNAVVAWLQLGGSGVELWAKPLDRTTGWETAERLTATSSAFLLHAMAFDDGSVLVLWEEDPTMAPRLWESVYRPGSGWDTHELGFDASGFTVPTLVRARSGALMWVYNEQQANLTPLRYRIRSAEGTWSDARTLAENAPQSSPPSVAPYDRESFRIVYGRPDDRDTGRDLWTARYLPDNGFVNDEPIATDYFTQERSKVAVDDSGRGIVIWLHSDQPMGTPITSLHARWFE